MAVKNFNQGLDLELKTIVSLRATNASGSMGSGSSMVLKLSGRLELQPISTMMKIQLYGTNIL